MTILQIFTLTAALFALACISTLMWITILDYIREMRSTNEDEEACKRILHEISQDLKNRRNQPRDERG